MARLSAISACAHSLPDTRQPQNFTHRFAHGSGAIPSHQCLRLFSSREQADERQRDAAGYAEDQQTVGVPGACRIDTISYTMLCTPFARNGRNLPNRRARGIERLLLAVLAARCSIP